MILLFGGTTEGRKAAATLDVAGKQFYYSTFGNLQRLESKNGICISGGMNAAQIEAFCKTHAILLIVDAAHPFAEQLHTNISIAASRLSIRVIRYERHYSARSESVVWADDFSDAIEKMRSAGVQRLLALTGVKTISKLSPWWNENYTVFRVLRRKESLDIVDRCKFPKERICYFEDGESVETLANRWGVDAMITKESGESGLFEEKVESALKSGLKIFAVKRPQLSESFITVYGVNGLRFKLERELPEFYSLRTGITSGSCVAAAAKAAALHLTSGKSSNNVWLTLPCGEPINIGVQFISKTETCVTYGVIKDSGDDPDVMNGRMIGATVSYASGGDITFCRGEGIGVVTLPGLGLEVGQPAINVVPRLMITNALREVNACSGFCVKPFVEGGEELAKKTFNPKLGVEGGVSIIGTSGIIRPFSIDAFIESIRREIQVAKALNVSELVLNSGAKSTGMLRCIYPSLPEQAFVHYGNFIGDALRVAQEESIPKVVLGIMIGKAVKLAAGNLNTYSGNVEIDREFISSLAKEAGLDQIVTARIKDMKFARELWSIIPSEHKFYVMLTEKMQKVCSSVFFKGALTIHLLQES